MNEKGLMVYVLRTPDMDCTNNGVSSRHDRFTLIGEGVSGVFEPTPETPALLLVERTICGGRKYLHAVPADIGKRHSMFGGNFITASDSRFPNDYPIPIHDRFE